MIGVGLSGLARLPRFARVPAPLLRAPAPAPPPPSSSLSGSESLATPRLSLRLMAFWLWPGVQYLQRHWPSRPFMSHIACSTNSIGERKMVGASCVRLIVVVVVGPRCGAPCRYASVRGLAASVLTPVLCNQSVYPSGNLRSFHTGDAMDRQKSVCVSERQGGFQQ
jgi:hypothetical protein